MKLRRAEQGTGVVEVVLIMVIVGLIGFIGWFVWHSQQSANATLSNANKTSAGVVRTNVDSFASCKKASGSKMLETYPEQCVTKDGKTFANTDQTIKYLVIAEWGVKIDTSAPALSGAVYVKSNPTPDGVERVLLATKNTASMDYTCGGQPGDGGQPVSHMQNGDQDYLLRSKTTDALVANSNQPATAFVKIGDYYYVYAHNTGHGDCVITDAAIAKQAEAAANAYTKSTILAQ